MKIADYHWCMQLALEEANQAYSKGEVPVGCVIADSDGKIISRAHNLKEQNKLSFHHAEMLAIQKASEELGAWRLLDCTLVVTLEPCPKCLSAILQSRIKTLVFGAYDPKGGSLSLGYNFARDIRLNHSFDVIGGISHFECSKILSDFFKQRRKSYKK